MTEFKTLLEGFTILPDQAEASVNSRMGCLKSSSPKTEKKNEEEVRDAMGED